MASEDNLTSLEVQALKRKERLKALKRKHEDGGKDGGLPEDKTQNSSVLPKPKFRSYRPQDDNLKENVIPDALPCDVEAEVKHQLESASGKVVIEDLFLFIYLIEETNDGKPIFMLYCFLKAAIITLVKYHVQLQRKTAEKASEN